MAPKDVSYAMHELVSKYIEQLTFEDIVRFHSEFEHIHPFQDGNGRVGRLLMYRQCLVNDIVPVLVDDRYRTEYIVAIRESHAGNFEKLEELFRKFQAEYEEELKQFII